MRSNWLEDSKPVTMYCYFLIANKVEHDITAVKVRSVVMQFMEILYTTCIRFPMMAKWNRKK